MNVCVAIFDFLKRFFQQRVEVTIQVKAKEHKYPMATNRFKPSWIVIHHSFSSDGQTRNWDSIRAYHMSFRYQGNTITEQQYAQYLADGKTAGLEKPWADVSYQFGVENINGKLEVLTGRAIGEIGAHAIGFNDKSIGICLIGNYDLDSPSEDRLFTVASLCRQMQLEFGIPRDQVLGHRETFVKRGVPVEKTCPGSQFDLVKFRARLRD